MSASEFNVGTELFSGWVLVLFLFGLIVGMYYFVVIRQPAKPFAFTLPPKLNELVAKTLSMLSTLPYIGKYIQSSKKEEFFPLKYPEIAVSKARADSGNLISTEEFGLRSVEIQSLDEETKNEVPLFEIG